MSLGSAHDVGRSLLELGLVDRESWSEIWPEVSEWDGDKLIDVLQSRGILTGMQVDKLRKGDESGYFLGKYMLQYRISAGTFARVYRAADVETGNTVAVKVLRGRHSMDPESVRQFHREAKLTEKLNHVNLVRTLEVGTEPETGQHYLAMEFVEGGNLRELIRIRERFPAKEVVRLGIQMVEGLDAALKSGITHRDIKPTNILFTTDGNIKWVDFGLAGVSEGKTSMTPMMKMERYDEQTQRTVDYAGLEKLTGAPKGDARSDIFFLGNVMRLMATGESALPDTRDRNDRMNRARFDAIKEVEGHPDVPPQLAKIIDRMLRVQPESRYQNYPDIIKDLRAIEVTIEKASETYKAGQSHRVGLDGFPPGEPRVLVVHGKEKLHDDLKSKLEKRGYHVVCNADFGRTAMLHEMKPFHAMVIDLATVGKEGVKTFAKLQRKGKYFLACVFISCSETQTSWTTELGDDKVATVEGQPATLTQVRRALAKLLPGVDRSEEQESETA